MYEDITAILGRNSHFARASARSCTAHNLDVYVFVRSMMLAYDTFARFC